MDWSDRILYAIVGAVGVTGIALFAMLFWLDEVRWPIIGAATPVGGIAGALIGEKIWELLRGLWDAT